MKSYIHISTDKTFLHIGIFKRFTGLGFHLSFVEAGHWNSKHLSTLRFDLLFFRLIWARHKPIVFRKESIDNLSPMCKEHHEKERGRIK